MSDGWKNKVNNQKYLVFTLRNMNVDQVYLTFRNTTPMKEESENLVEWIKNSIQLAFIPSTALM